MRRKLEVRRGRSHGGHRKIFGVLVARSQPYPTGRETTLVGKEDESLSGASPSSELGIDTIYGRRLRRRIKRGFGRFARFAASNFAI